MKICVRGVELAWLVGGMATVAIMEESMAACNMPPPFLGATGWVGAGLGKKLPGTCKSHMLYDPLGRRPEEEKGGIPEDIGCSLEGLSPTAPKDASDKDSDWEGGQAEVAFSDCPQMLSTFFDVGGNSPAAPHPD